MSVEWEFTFTELTTSVPKAYLLPTTNLERACSNDLHFIDEEVEV